MNSLKRTEVPKNLKSQDRSKDEDKDPIKKIRGIVLRKLNVVCPFLGVSGYVLLANTGSHRNNYQNMQKGRINRDYDGWISMRNNLPSYLHTQVFGSS